MEAVKSLATKDSRKGAKAQRKIAKALNAIRSLRAFLCAFAPLRESFLSICFCGFVAHL